MIRYTDPTVELTVKGIDLTGADIWATFRQGAHAETFVPENVAYDAEEGTSMEVSMTQLDSAGFSVGTADVQVIFG